MLMTKRQIADAALREQIARWTRAAVGSLVEEDDTVCAVAVPVVVRYSRGKRCRENAIMGCNNIIQRSHGADQSAVGAINRPLRRLRRRTWDTVVNLFMSIIASLHPAP